MLAVGTGGVVSSVQIEILSHPKPPTKTNMQVTKDIFSRSATEFQLRLKRLPEKNDILFY